LIFELVYPRIASLLRNRTEPIAGLSTRSMTYPHEPLSTMEGLFLASVFIPFRLFSSFSYSVIPNHFSRVLIDFLDFRSPIFADGYTEWVTPLLVLRQFNSRLLPALVPRIRVCPVKNFQSRAPFTISLPLHLSLCWEFSIFLVAPTRNFLFMYCSRFQRPLVGPLWLRTR